MTLGTSEGMLLTIGYLGMTPDAYILKLGGVDMIFGVVWLEKLGKVTVYWKNMSMIFNYLGRHITFPGKSNRDA